MLNEWRVSGENAAVFCRNHGYKYLQFYDWRKTIEQRDAESAAVAKRQTKKIRRAAFSREPSGFVSVKLVESAPEPAAGANGMEVVRVVALSCVSLRIANLSSYLQLSQHWRIVHAKPFAFDSNFCIYQTRRHEAKLQWFV